MSKTRLNVPDNIKPYIVAEYCDDFPIDRYYKTAQIDDIIASIETTRKVSSEMNKMGIGYMNSTLLYSVPGTGKTTLGRYIAYVFGKDFIYLDFARIFSLANNNAAGIIADIFEFASESDCIFMLDEIDCVSQKRGTDDENSSVDKNLFTVVIMQQLDRLRSSKAKCIILGATNRRDIMDEALISRFSVTVEVKTLTNAEKEGYICMYLGNVNYTSPDGKKGIPYDMKNIMEYCARNNYIRQRNIESDINRCIANWIMNDKKDFKLVHIKENG